MKPRVSHQKTAAMTLVEALVVVVVLAVLAVLILPAFSNARRQDPRMHQCVLNLKQVGFAYQVWAYNHNGKFPMEVSVANGGTKELSADGKNLWLNFLVLSNELGTPKLLVCPADKGRIAARTFASGFSAKNISYFVGLDAITNHPRMFLSGDDNFAIGGISVKAGMLGLSTNAPITWTATRHEHENVGNIGLADGSVVQTTSSSLQQMLVQTSLATNRLAIP